MVMQVRDAEACPIMKVTGGGDERRCSLTVRCLLVSSSCTDACEILTLVPATNTTACNDFIETSRANQRGDIAGVLVASSLVPAPPQKVWNRHNMDL